MTDYGPPKVLWRIVYLFGHGFPDVYEWVHRTRIVYSAEYRDRILADIAAHPTHMRLDSVERTDTHWIREDIDATSNTQS